MTALSRTIVGIASMSCTVLCHLLGWFTAVPIALFLSFDLDELSVGRHTANWAAEKIVRLEQRKGALFNDKPNLARQARTMVRPKKLGNN